MTIKEDLEVITINPFWREIHQRQKESGWCAAASIYLILKYAQKLSENKGKNVKLPTEEEIYKAVNIDWFGSTNGISVAYLSRFFSDMGQKTNASFDDLFDHLKKENIIIVDWTDDSPPPPPEGHYCILAGYDKNKNMLTFVDTSRDGRDIWECSASEFDKKWFDHEGMQEQNDLKVNRWFMWINPKSLNPDVLS